MELVQNYANGIVRASDGKLSIEEVMASPGVRNYARRVGVDL
jgi:hypothetical protein